MEIINNFGRKMYFSDLEIGDIFVFEGEYYIKTDEVFNSDSDNKYNCLCLSDNCFDCFYAADDVLLIKATLTIG